MRDKKHNKKTQLIDGGYFIGRFVFDEKTKTSQQLGYWEVLWRKGFNIEKTYYAR